MKTKLEKAVKVLTKAIKSDNELFLSYRANIAMAFVDEYDNTAKDNRIGDIPEIANAAAINFLNIWIKTGSA